MALAGLAGKTSTVPIDLFFGMELWMINCLFMPTFRTHSIKQLLQLCKLILLVHGVFHLKPNSLQKQKIRLLYIDLTEFRDFYGSSELRAGDHMNQVLIILQRSNIALYTVN
jgi:hypothetical protein